MGTNMSDWLHSLPVAWMALLVFGVTYLLAAAIYAVVTILSVGERARSFKAISPGLLPPLGIIFGLFVAFTAAQVWTDNEKARTEIDREASALRSVVILATSFPRESGPCDLLVPRGRGGGWSNELRNQSCRCGASERPPYRPYSQGRKSSRSAGRAADQVRVRDQSQDRQHARPGNSGDAARACRRGDRVSNCNPYMSAGILCPRARASLC